MSGAARSLERQRISWRWSVALATLAGFLLRVLPIGATPLWRDEIAQIDAAMSPSMFAAIRDHIGAAPLDYLGTRLAVTLAGDPLVGARVWALLAGSLSVPFAFLAGRAWFGARAGYAAMALVALSPFLIYYSTEARFYALAVTLALVNFWALRERRWILYATSAAAGLLTMYSFVPILVVSGAYLLYSREWRGIAGLAFACLAFVPWAAYALPGELGLQYDWERHGLPESAGYALVAQHGLGGPLLLGISLATLSLAGAVIALRRWHGSWPLAAAACAVMVTVWWMTYNSGYFWVPRQTILVLPVLFLLAAGGWSTLRTGPAVTSAGLYAALLMSSLVTVVTGTVGMR